MLKLTILVIVDVLIGIAAAAVLLAVLVPSLIGQHLIAPGDLAGLIIICAILILAIAVMVFRPGSALHRFGTRTK